MTGEDIMDQAKQVAVDTVEEILQERLGEAEDGLKDILEAVARHTSAEPLNEDVVLEDILHAVRDALLDDEGKLLSADEVDYSHVQDVANIYATLKYGIRK